MKPKIKYRSQWRFMLWNRYWLEAPYEIRIPIPTNMIIETPFIRMYPINDRDSLLRIGREYRWDGASGPSIDTESIMRGSLVHDALYQLIRSEALDIKHKTTADDLLRKICIEDGMNRFRAWYIWKAVRLFGGWAIKPGSGAILQDY